VQLFLLEKLPEYSFSGWQQLEKYSGRSAGLNAPDSRRIPGLAVGISARCGTDAQQVL
jgi:hypothetical protein